MLCYMLHYACVVLALGFSVGQLARPHLCMSCAVWFVPATHTRRGVNEVLTLSYHLSSFFSLDFSPSFQGFLSSLLPPIFHSPQNISTFSSLPQQNSKNFPSYLLFTSLTTTGMLHFLKVRSHSWGLQKFASFRFWVCLFHPSIVVSLILIAELNQTFFFFYVGLCYFIGREDLLWYCLGIWDSHYYGC